MIRMEARCSDPAYTAEIKNHSDWGAYCRRLPKKGLKPFIVDAGTGEVLLEAGSCNPSAVAKFFREMGEDVTVLADASGKGSPVETPYGETMFPLEVYLPSEIFALYNHALGAGYTDQPDIVSFLVEYAELGFMQKHGVVLTLAPVEDFLLSENSSDSQLNARIGKLEKNVALILQVLGQLTSSEKPNSSDGKEIAGGGDGG